MKEVWKDIEGYEGYYQASDLGRIKSLDRYVLNDGKINFLKGKILKEQKQNNGYLKVTLSKDGMLKDYRIHRLVAQAFIPEIEGKNTVNHKDENRTNNRVDNLEWANMSEQNTYNGRSFKVGKTKAKAVICLETNKTYYSVREAERQTRIKQSNISMCCNGMFKQAGGYRWRYLNEET